MLKKTVGAGTIYSQTSPYEDVFLMLSDALCLRLFTTCDWRNAGEIFHVDRVASLRLYRRLTRGV